MNSYKIINNMTIFPYEVYERAEVFYTDSYTITDESYLYLLENLLLTTTIITFGFIIVGFIIVYQYNKLYDAYNMLLEEVENPPNILDQIDSMNDDEIHEILMKCSQNTFIPNWYDKKYFEKVVNWGENITKTRWHKVCTDNSTSYQEFMDAIDTAVVCWYINNYNPTLKEYPTTTDSSSDEQSSSGTDSGTDTEHSDSDSDYVPEDSSSDSDTKDD